MKKNIYFCLVLIFIISFSACNKLPTGEKDEGNILAKVNGWTLTEKEFNDQIDSIIKANNGQAVVPVAVLGLLNRTFIPPYIEEIDLSSTEGKQLYLNLMINLELLAQEAQMRKLDQEPDIAKDIRRTRIEILDLALLNEVLKKVTITPLEIENFYENEYKKTLENINQRKVREIVVDTEAKATGILVELLQGADFASLASIRSIAESAKDGGDLGYMVYQPNKKFQKFWEVVLLLDKGQVSSIFQDPVTKNFYIVKIEDIKKGEPESLSKIYDQLEFLLRQKKSVEAIDDLIADIKSKVEVEINSKLLEN
ncbi:MAG: peptidylprolyl isomerase [Candidatus Omnitrophica bacterium]|nr:peptidylprolyl isomerase [Candidatus Omnitrophota bacterium]